MRQATPPLADYTRFDVDCIFRVFDITEMTFIQVQKTIHQILEPQYVSPAVKKKKKTGSDQAQTPPIVQIRHERLCIDMTSVVSEYRDTLPWKRKVGTPR